MWEEFLARVKEECTLDFMLEMIEDALCYNFEFKVENHKLFWREM